MINEQIKVMIPDMPRANDLKPYLDKIDLNLQYSNRGPLVNELEDRLSNMFQSPCVAVSNGTLALQLAIHGYAEKESQDPIALVPGLTFSATALAASNAGLEVHLDDVNIDTWQMDPRNITGRNSISVPVAVFGAPVPLDSWEDHPGKAVIDAAGAIMEQVVSQEPHIATCYSLHATKFIGAGEGGIVASHNQGLIDSVRDKLAFGVNGTNAKMSEYHAAVALASLDRALDKFLATCELVEYYKRNGIDRFKHSHLTGYSTLLVIELPDNVPLLWVVKYLSKNRIETKQWYRPFPSERSDINTKWIPLPNTQRLTKSLLGIPFHTRLSYQQVEHICKTLEDLLL